MKTKKKMKNECSKSFYIIYFCNIIMEMTVLPELEETLQTWKKKKQKKKKEKDEQEEHEEKD